MKKLSYLSVLLLFVLSQSCSNEGFSDFQKRNFIKFLGNGLGTVGNDIMQLEDGTYILTGNQKVASMENQILISKLDQYGNVLWEKLYGESKNDEGICIQSADGIVVLAGNTVNPTTLKTDVFILSVGPEGDTLWFRKFGGLQNDYLKDLLIWGENIYAVGARQNQTNLDKNYYIIKIDKNGNLIKEIEFNFSGEDEFLKVVNHNENLLIFGKTNGVIGIQSSQISMIKLNSELIGLFFGNVSTEGNTSLQDVILLNNQIYLLSKNTDTDASMLICLSDTYNELWRKEMEPGFVAECLILDGSDRLVISGAKDNNIAIKLFDLMGDELNESEAFNELPGYVNSMIKTADEGFAIIGSTVSNYGTMCQFVKIDASFTLLTH